MENTTYLISAPFLVNGTFSSAIIAHSIKSPHKSNEKLKHFNDIFLFWFTNTNKAKQNICRKVLSIFAGSMRLNS